MSKLKSILSVSLQVIVGVPLVLLLVFSQFSGCISEASLYAEHGVGALFGQHKASPAVEYHRAANKTQRCAGTAVLEGSYSYSVEITYLKIDSGPLAGEYHDIWMRKSDSLWETRLFQTLDGTIISAEEVPLLESAGGRFSRGSHRRFIEDMTGTKVFTGFALIELMRLNGTFHMVQ